MWIRAAGQRLTAPFCLEVVITLSRGRDLALVRVGMAFDLFLRPQHIRVMTLSDRLIVQSGGETFPLMLHRHCFLRPPNVYRQDRLDYILGWVTAWQFETLCSDLIVAAAT